MAQRPQRQTQVNSNFEEDNTILKSEVKSPFPGLRPFTPDETHLYFGREGQVGEILSKLSRHKSVAVLGSSGSGKSSLIYCGVVPVLYGGFVTDTSPNWKVITARPGISPIDNLADAILDYQISRGRVAESDQKIQRAILRSMLRGTPNALVEVTKNIQSHIGENVCFLIDQFEELFRFKQIEGEESENEASLYVNLILNAVNQKETPIYTAISMRSDFINETNEFPGLAKIINQSSYVVPTMSREQFRKAIEGPVAVGGGQISNRLTKRLLSDIMSVQDPLPILQHVLMRTWDYWVANHEPGEPLDLRHYNSVGRIAQALSQHANEAYEKLTSREKEIAEILFKSITEKNQDNQGIRRIAHIKEIVKLADASEEEVIRVADEFRAPGRSFLMPGTQVALNEDSVIEIAHESIMRIWTRLSGWVDDEFQSAQMYKRLCDASAAYQIGRAGLWRPPDLQLALNWQRKQNPTRIWGQRYDEAFERAIVFLDTSRITYEADLLNQEQIQKRMLRRARVTNIILGLAFLVAMLFFFFGLTQQIAAESKQKEAEIAAQKAESARILAQQQQQLADEAVKVIEGQQIEIQRNTDSLRIQLDRTRIAQAQAERNLREAKIQEENARMAQANEAEQRIKAEQAIVLAKSESEKRNALIYLSVAQTLVAKAETMEDAELSGLLAFQGHKFHTTYGGKKYDPYVFRGLYYASAKVRGLNYNALFVPGNFINRMTALTVSPKSDKFFTSGSDGRIFQGNVLSGKVDAQLGANPYSNRVLQISPDERFLVVGSDSSTLQVFDLGVASSPKAIAGHTGSINDIQFLPGTVTFLSVASDKTLRMANASTGKSDLKLSLPFELKTIDINTEGDALVGATADGKVILMDLNTNKFRILTDEGSNHVLSLAFHPSGKKVALGMEIIGNNSQVVRGIVKVIELNGSKTLELTGHKAGVSDVEYSPDGSLLASAGLDRKLQMWVVDKETDLPIVMDNNNGNIWNIAFAKGSDYLLASCNNGEIRMWPTNPDLLAKQIEPTIKRNMTPDEWDVYVGNGILYETTIKK